MQRFFCILPAYCKVLYSTHSEGEKAHINSGVARRDCMQIWSISFLLYLYVLYMQSQGWYGYTVRKKEGKRQEKIVR